MGFFAQCQFLPSHHLQNFEEMFLTGLSIFNPFNTNPTYRYIAYKDAKEGNPMHNLIKKAKDAEQSKRLQMASVTTYSRHQQKEKDH